MVESEHTDAGSDEAPVASLRIWFVLPLGRRLPIEAGWRHRRLRTGMRIGDFASQSIESTVEIHHRAVAIETSLAVPAEVSDVFHAMLSRCSPELASSAPLQASSPAPVHPPPPDAHAHDDDPPSHPAREATYAIVGTALEPDRWDNEKMAVSAAFDDAIEFLNSVTLALSVITPAPHGSVTTVRSEDLSHAIPMVIGDAPAHDPFSPTDIHAISAIVPRQMRARIEYSTTIEHVDSDHLRYGTDQFSGEHPFTASIEARRDAIEQLHVRGDRRVAVILACVAGEVMFDTLLLHMMWEEQLEPRLSAPVFDKILKTRLLSQYHARLGGDWLREGGDIWRFVDVLHLRNRVAHAAEHPTFDEAQQVIRALIDAETYVGDRLAANENRNRYPRTAYVWAGQRGLMRRGALTKRVERLASDPAEPHWHSSFARWRFHFFSARGWYPDAGHGRIYILAQIVPKGASYLAVDFDAGFAARLADVSPFLDEATMQEWQARIAAVGKVGEGVPAQGILVPRDAVQWTEVGLVWQPDYELLPEASWRLRSSEYDPAG